MRGSIARNVNEMAVLVVSSRDDVTVTGTSPWGGEDVGY